MADTPAPVRRDILNKVLDANLERKPKNLDRRLMKAGEEYGEALQAFIATTSKNNLKNKTWADVREEVTDFVIVGLDILLTRFPDESKDITESEIKDRIHAEFDRKLNKWLEKVNQRQQSVDDSE